MTTATTIITAALRELGVIGAGETATGEDLQLGLQLLNSLADAWLTEPGYAYSNEYVVASLAASTQSMTIGPGKQFNCARPLRLEDPGCYITAGNLDYPLDVIDQADYANIVLKTTTGPWPNLCMYDGGAPTGNVYFWPLGACTVHLFVRHQVSQWATVTTDVTLVPGYERAFRYTLLEDLAGPYGRPITQLQARNARSARRAIKRANFEVPSLTIGDPNLFETPVTRIKAG